MDEQAVHTTPATFLPKWMFSQKLFFKLSLPLNGQCGIQVCSPTSSDDLCLPFCICTSSKFCMFQAHSQGYGKKGVRTDYILPHCRHTSYRHAVRQLWKVVVATKPRDLLTTHYFVSGPGGVQDWAALPLLLPCLHHLSLGQVQIMQN